MKTLIKTLWKSITITNLNIQETVTTKKEFLIFILILLITVLITAVIGVKFVVQPNLDPLGYIIKSERLWTGVCFIIVSILDAIIILTIMSHLHKRTNK